MPVQPASEPKPAQADDFAAAMAMIASLPLSPEEKAQAVRQLMASKGNVANLEGK